MYAIRLSPEPVRESTHTTRRRHHCGHNKSPKTMFRAFENDIRYHWLGQASCPDDTFDVLKDTLFFQPSFFHAAFFLEIEKQGQTPLEPLAPVLGQLPFAVTTQKCVEPPTIGERNAW